MSVSVGFDLGRERLRGSAVRLAMVLALSFELGVALLERARAHAGAADRALTGGAFGVALPLFAYYAVGQVTAGTSLREAVTPLSRHGLDGRALTLGMLLPAASVVSAFAALGGCLVVLVARGPTDPGSWKDVLVTSWIGLISGAAYVTTLAGASAFGRRGRGRAWFLGLDFLLGGGSSFLALPWPKGHIRNLLGGVPVLDLSQAAATLALLGTSFAFLWLGTSRSGR